MTDWLTDRFRTLAADLAATLDLDAGLREALIPARRDDLISDLTGVLDVEAGLAAIVSTAPAARVADKPAQGSLPLEVVVRSLSSVAPATRLALRRQIRGLARMLALARIRDLATSLVSKWDADRGADFVDAVVEAYALVLAGTSVHAELDEILAATRARIVADTAEHARYLVNTGVYVRARDDARDVARKLGIAGELHIANIRRDDITTLTSAADDFTGADLRQAHLRGVPLEGLRWSESTRWPDGWAEPIRRASVPIASGVYEIRPGTATVRQDST
jgi:hypothetical protein